MHMWNMPGHNTSHCVYMGLHGLHGMTTVEAVNSPNTVWYKIAKSFSFLCSVV